MTNEDICNTVSYFYLRKNLVNYQTKGDFAVNEQWKTIRVGSFGWLLRESDMNIMGLRSWKKPEDSIQELLRFIEEKETLKIITMHQWVKESILNGKAMINEFAESHDGGGWSITLPDISNLADPWRPIGKQL